MSSKIGIHLVRREPGSARAALQRYGDPVGLPGVAAHLNRSAHRTKVPGRGPVWGFAWNDQDNHSTHWWPQGISTSADASSDGLVGGREMLVSTWYSHKSAPRKEGSRLTFVDLESLRYRHVLVVRVGKDGLEPLRIHAGGVVWAGDHLHLAGTARGIFTCHVEDILEVEPSPETYDYRYVLPVRITYRAGQDESVERLRYSFLSLDRGAEPPQLVAGEYGVQGQSTRLVRFPLDPETFALAGDEQGVSQPLLLHEGIGHMQGAAVVGRDYYLTQSRGRYRLGHLWVRRARPVPAAPLGAAAGSGGHLLLAGEGPAVVVVRVPRAAAGVRDGAPTRVRPPPAAADHAAGDPAPTLRSTR